MEEFSAKLWKDFVRNFVEIPGFCACFFPAGGPAPLMGLFGWHAAPFGTLRGVKFGRIFGETPEGFCPEFCENPRSLRLRFPFGVWSPSGALWVACGSLRNPAVGQIRKNFWLIGGMISSEIKRRGVRKKGHSQAMKNTRPSITHPAYGQKFTVTGPA